MERLVARGERDYRPVDFKIPFPSTDDPQWQRRFTNSHDRLNDNQQWYSNTTTRPARFSYSFDCVDEFALRQGLKNDITVSGMVGKKLPKREHVPIDAHDKESNNDCAASKPPA